ncbi:hypothetical protein ONZ45_g3608 [Pleurotus djamor]|nr:hypothetical protein ONZ45_g3608 [Pleurotus djamor]
MSLFPLDSKLALITGCTGGIGYATALRLARSGCSIAIHYHRNQSKAMQIIEQINALNSSLNPPTPIRAQAFQADLGDLNDVRRLHAEVLDQMGNLDILFNNAGITGKRIGREGVIEDVSVENFTETWTTNVAQCYLLAQLCIPHMRGQQYGRIIFTSSVATTGLVSPQYASSKSALHGLMHWIANRYVKDGITSNVVAPAFITGTEMAFDIPPAALKMVPMERWGTTEEVASCVELLVNNAYMTNKIIALDGGMVPSAF